MRSRGGKIVFSMISGPWGWKMDGQIWLINETNGMLRQKEECRNAKEQIMPKKKRSMSRRKQAAE